MMQQRGGNQVQCRRCPRSTNASRAHIGTIFDEGPADICRNELPADFVSQSIAITTRANG